MDSNRIKEIQQTTAYPNSTSVMGALNQVWNECEQENKHRIKELEGTIENNTTEVSKFFNDGVEIFECNSCGMLMEENEPYDNYCCNCGRKIKK